MGLPWGLAAGVGLFAGGDQPGVADVAAVPAGEDPVVDDVRVEDYLDEHFVHRHILKFVELDIADFPQDFVALAQIGGVAQLVPQLEEFVGFVLVGPQSGGTCIVCTSCRQLEAYRSSCYTSVCSILIGGALGTRQCNLLIGGALGTRPCNLPWRSLGNKAV